MKKIREMIKNKDRGWQMLGITFWHFRLVKGFPVWLIVILLPVLVSFMFLFMIIGLTWYCLASIYDLAEFIKETNNEYDRMNRS